jgi:outer membrane protein insertion porin family
MDRTGMRQQFSTTGSDDRQARRRARALGAVLLAVVWLAGAWPSWAQVQTIEDIRWEGLRRIPRDTMNARILSKQGDLYDPDALRRDFQSVWNTNFFEDVRMEVEDGETGKIIYFIVQERPLIRRITYDGVKSVQESEILEAFREARVGLTVEMQYDPTRVRHAEVVLKQLLSFRGRHFAKVWHNTRRIPPNAVILTFVVEEGPKVKVGRVRLDGNRRFSDRRLVRAMKNSRPYGLPPGYLGMFPKTYNAFKVEEDLERVRELYQEHGYFRVIVHPPETRYRDTKPFMMLRMFPFWFKDGKAVDMRVALEEGVRYRMGTLEVLSATGKNEDLFFHPDFLKATFPLREGDLFNVTKIREALEDYRKLYSELGFINMTTVPETDIDDDARVINMTLEFEPNKQFFVHRIEFQGNTHTRDKVIRRELLLDEGAVFNSRLWELSILRLNQLGYFEELTPESGEVQQNAERGTIDLNLKVKEKGRNSIGLTGGASGVLGSFAAVNYSTNNFLGLGETLSVSVEGGDRQKSFVFGFTEPYLFDRPLQTGFTFFIRRFEFNQAREALITTGQTFNPIFEDRLLNFIQETTGFSVFASYPLRSRRFTRLGLTYSFSDSDISCDTDVCNTLFEQLNFRSTIGGQNALQGIRSSRVTPSFLYNSTNHSLFPTQGTSLFVSTTFEGGPLGGNQKIFLPTFEMKHFRPVNRGRNTLAFRLLGSFVSGFGGQVPSPVNRFYIGGEDSVRGFDIRAISPMAFIPASLTIPVFFLDPTKLDANGNPTVTATNVNVLTQTISFPGGDAQLVANVEYRIPIVGPVTIAPFFDAGMNTVLNTSQLRLNDQVVEALRDAFPRGEIADDLKLVPNTNARLRSSAGLEFVVNLPIVNAPFRVYWAYNLNRLTEDIVIPAASFELPQGVELPPGVFENQILPVLSANPLFQERTGAFVEPLKTFRFTVSRTF